MKKFVHHVIDYWDEEADGPTQWSVIRDNMVWICNEVLERLWETT